MEAFLVLSDTSMEHPADAQVQEALGRSLEELDRLLGIRRNLRE